MPRGPADNRWLNVVVLVLGCISAGYGGFMLLGQAFICVRLALTSGLAWTDVARLAYGVVLLVVGVGYIITWARLRRGDQRARRSGTATAVVAIVWCSGAGVVGILSLVYTPSGPMTAHGIFIFGARIFPLLIFAVFAAAHVIVLRGLRKV